MMKMSVPPFLFQHGRTTVCLKVIHLRLQMNVFDRFVFALDNELFVIVIIFIKVNYYFAEFRTSDWIDNLTRYRRVEIYRA